MSLYELNKINNTRERDSYIMKLLLKYSNSNNANMLYDITDMEAQDYLVKQAAASVTVPGNVQYAFNRFITKCKLKGTRPYILGFFPIYGNATTSLLELFGGTTATTTAAPTYGSNGFTFNGTTQFVNLKIKPSIRSLRNITMGFQRFANFDASPVAGASMGCQDTGNNKYLLLFPRHKDVDTSGFRIGTENINNLGKYPYASDYRIKTSLTTFKGQCFQNFNLIGETTGVVPDETGPDVEITLGALNSNGTPSSFTDDNIACAWVTENMPEELEREFLADKTELMNALGRGAARLICFGHSFVEQGHFNTRLATVFPNYQVQGGVAPFGIGGQTVEQILERFPTVAALQSNPYITRNVLVFIGARNSLHFGHGVDKTFTDTLRLEAEATGRGFDFVFSNELPSSNILNPNIEEERLKFNEITRKVYNIKTHNKGVFKKVSNDGIDRVMVDFGSDLVMGQTGQNIAGANWTDATHPSSTGGSYLTDVLLADGIKST